MPLQRCSTWIAAQFTVIPVGAARDARTDAWVIAATNEPMASLTAAGLIRHDLAYRLTGIVIRVPSLDERREDIPQLVRHFLFHSGYPDAPLNSGVIAHLQRQSWGGNVRELRQIVEWSAALSGGHLTKRVVEQTLADRIAAFAATTPNHPERSELQDLLTRHDWNTDTAARELGIHRATLYRRMKRHCLSTPRSFSAQRSANIAEHRVPPGMRRVELIVRRVQSGAR